MMRWVPLALLVACVSPNHVVCEDGRTCPADTTCHIGLASCVTADQQSACAGMPDGATCDLTDSVELCEQGACIETVCGNGRTDINEACDDGNTSPDDGCSADCLSDETCGNGVPDPSQGEQCDDGNFRDHDGCASACRQETPRWIRRPLAPNGRMAPAIAYDAARDAIVLVGGHGTLLTGEGLLGRELDDTWLWDGRWRESPIEPPPPRGRAALVYDTTRQRLLYYGVLSGSGELWEQDGATWRLVHASASTEPSMPDPAIAYDSIRDRIVMLGGRHPTNTTTSEMWEWDGTQWEPRVLPTTGIRQPRFDTAMVFDPKRGKLVLFGGTNVGGTRLNDLWEFDGSSWSQPAASGTAPTPRSGHSMAWNASCECVVLYGGVTGPGVTSNETFLWDGTMWTKPAIPQNMTPRGFAGLVSDGHGNTLLVGGSRNGETSDYFANTTPNFLAETWLFDGASWRQQLAVRSSHVAFDLHRRRIVVHGGGYVGVPPEHHHETLELGEHGWRRVAMTGPDSDSEFSGIRGAAMTYDEARRTTVLVGGQRSDGAMETATWLWDGATWTPAAVATSLPPRTAHVVVFDAARGEVVAFGGCDDEGTCNNETWTYEGATWTQRAPATSPPARGRAAIAYDRANKQVVMFGANAKDLELADTWVWNGTSWTDVTPPGPGPSSIRPLMAWDPARRRVVLVSGSFLQAWEWTGSTWSSLGSIGNIPAPLEGALVSGFEGAGLMLLGGQPAVAGDADDSLELVWTASAAEDVCRLASDGDGDDKAGCADPDCWFVCTPGCGPEEVCASPMPGCGDGTCDPAESCRSCPDDCLTCDDICGDGVCDPNESCPGDC